MNLSVPSGKCSQRVWGQCAWEAAEVDSRRRGDQVEAAEHHAHVEADWYMLTVTTDLLAFIYVALFYQVPLMALQAFQAKPLCLSPARMLMLRSNASPIVTAAAHSGGMSSQRFSWSTLQNLLLQHRSCWLRCGLGNKINHCLTPLKASLKGTKI